MRRTGRGVRFGERRGRALMIVGCKAGRWWDPAQLLDDLQAVLHRAAHEAFEDFLEAERKAQLCEHAVQDTTGDGLAVDQHPITIENHQLELGRAAAT